MARFRVKHQIRPWVMECMYIHVEKSPFCRLSTFHARRCNAAPRPRKSERTVRRRHVSTYQTQLHVTIIRLCFAPVDSRRCGLILPVARLIATQSRRVGLRTSSGWTVPVPIGSQVNKVCIMRTTRCLAPPEGCISTRCMTARPTLYIGGLV
ncbi:unnamed protein product [Fusarium graminearum]|uniref:Chromosome 1, complete genome n=1 Tax=Gibberella zeae (strain ATCC MYA-4620 / CBS 123657 / FGSC 9075 / NRRL 31084 / PH-1) TaxID=229533 RepID=A0A098D3B0_GIBZE|nr:unnamed protein product [Fusarium graminearum]CZS76735.1 unnamed protein product [Fusarium graminearum]